MPARRTRHDAQCPCGCDYRPWNTISSTERARLRELVELTYGRQCWLCLRQIPAGQFSVDHVIPDSHHGGHDLSNLRPAHKVCNSARGNRARTPTTIVRPERLQWTA